MTTLTDHRVRQGVLAVAIALGLAASVPNAFLTRTQAAQVASAVLARAHHGDVIAYCPDQLGPAVSRELGDRFDEIAFPRANPPEIVDWVDYATTVEAREHKQFREAPVVAGGTETSHLVRLGTGLPQFRERLSGDRQRPRRPASPARIVGERASDTPFEIFEGESLYRYAPS